MKTRIKLLGSTGLFVLVYLFTVIGQNSALAQITANPNDAGTVVDQSGNTLNIQGGTEAGKNLHHSFEKFGVNQGQTVNFISQPEIENILGRVTGGDASIINGLIKVTGGNSNLYLINPAGIIFGSGASLDVPAAFTATTANGVRFGDNWLKAFGTNDYASLIGNPDAFAFTQSGVILNSGNLAVKEGQNLTLLGGTVISTGTLKAPEGDITVAAVPEEKLVRITQQGNLLSFGLPVETKAVVSNQPFTPLSLPQLLTGGNLSSATDVEVDENGVVKLTRSGFDVENGVVKLTRSEVEIPKNAGTTFVTGDIIFNYSGRNSIDALRVSILGEEVGIFDVYIGGSSNLRENNITFNATENIKVKNSILKSKILNFYSQNNSIAIEGSRFAISSSKKNGNLTLNATENIKVKKSYFSTFSTTENITVNSQNDSILIEDSELKSTGDINIKSTNRVELTESGLIAEDGNITITANEGIEIKLIQSPRFLLRSGGDFSLISNKDIIANARISSGGNFSVKSENFNQPALTLNGIISSNGDVNFDDYKGSSLKIEAKGSIRGGNITLDKIGTFPQNGDPDINILNAGSALILRAGVTELANPPQSANIGATSFTSTTNPSSRGGIQVGNINTSVGGRDGSVTMSATGNINAGHIKTEGDGIAEGFVDLQATGDIEVKTINTSGVDGGDIKIIAGGLFRATDSFLQNDQNDNSRSYGSNVNGEKVFGEIPTSIYATTLHGPVNISIQHGGRSFIIGPRFERDADGKLVFRDDNGNLLPYTVDASGFVRDADNKTLRNIVIGSPINQANLEAYTSFTAGAITTINRNGAYVSSFRDSPLENSENITFPIENIKKFSSYMPQGLDGRMQITFDAQPIPEDTSLESSNNTFSGSAEVQVPVSSDQQSIPNDGQSQITFDPQPIPTDTSLEGSDNTSSGSAEVQVPVSSDQQSIPDDGQIQVTFDPQLIPPDTSLESSNNTSSGATEGQVSVSSDQQSIPDADAEAVQRQLTKKEQNNICSPKNSTTAFNRTENTRSGRTTNNSQSPNNVPCKTPDNNNNILKVIPDTRFDSNSALPVTRPR
jgi:filamentous hemagglutinin family protein